MNQNMREISNISFFYMGLASLNMRHSKFKLLAQWVLSCHPTDKYVALVSVTVKRLVTASAGTVVHK